METKKTKGHFNKLSGPEKLSIFYWESAKSPWQGRIGDCGWPEHPVTSLTARSPPKPPAELCVTVWRCHLPLSISSVPPAGHPQASLGNSGILFTFPPPGAASGLLEVVSLQEESCLPCWGCISAFILILSLFPTCRRKG